MKNQNCIICNEQLKQNSNLLWAALWHFRLIEFKQWPWFKGTYKHFGLSSAISLICPLYNTLRHWKYRRFKLTSKFLSLEDMPIVK
jgi:hypothetical protein